jgi:hypothetical protein
MLDLSNPYQGRIPARGSLDHLEMVSPGRDPDSNCPFVYLGRIWRSGLGSPCLWDCEDGRTGGLRGVEMGKLRVYVEKGVN